MTAPCEFLRGTCLEPAVDQAGQPLGVTGNQLRRQHQQQPIGQDHFGLDHSQVRLYTALLRHLILTTAAQAVCAVTAAVMRSVTSTLPPPLTSPTETPPPDRD